MLVTKKKGRNWKTEMNYNEINFLNWYKSKYPTHHIEKNITSFVIWQGKKTQITYTPDFLVIVEGKTLYVEVKGWTQSNEVWDLKRKLVIEYFGDTFEEYRPIGKVFYSYGEWKFELNRRKHLNKWKKRLNGPKEKNPKNKILAKIKAWEEITYDTRTSK